jgi:hypothetical protein
MNPELFVSIIAALVSALAGGLTATNVVRKLIYRILNKELPQKTYSERLSELTGSLSKASQEVDGVLREMASVAHERETSVKELEIGLKDLELREKELKEKIAILQSVPIPVAEQFAKLVEPSEKRSARRDYLLFISGVVVTTIIAVSLQFLTVKTQKVEQSVPGYPPQGVGSPEP